MVSLIIVPLILFCMVYLTTGKIRQPRWRRQQQQRAVTCDVGGEAGIAKRNRRFLALVETPWEGATTMAILFEQACERFSGNKCLGTRTLVSQETEVSADGRRFEKVTLGNYFWITYELSLQRVRHFASGLVAIGHQRGERLAIFSETRAEWFLALQVPPPPSSPIPLASSYLCLQQETKLRRVMLLCTYPFMIKIDATNFCTKDASYQVYQQSISMDNLIEIMTDMEKKVPSFLESLCKLLCSMH